MTKKILIVDDDDLNRDIISELLSNTGAAFDVATDGLEAYTLSKSKDYDLIYMDLMMPNMDGLEATKRIREALSHKTQPRIIALSAKELSHQREKLTAVGFDGFIKKPFCEEQILSHLA